VLGDSPTAWPPERGPCSGQNVAAERGHARKLAYHWSHTKSLRNKTDGRLPAG
jgi:hypothetical protein